jgi:hypothetical protein
MIPMATSKNESKWLQDAFIEDEASASFEAVQGRPFLRTGLRPTSGQRVELKILLRQEQEQQGNMPTKPSWCRLSGQVTHVKPEPTEWFPKTHDTDKKGSYALSFFLGSTVYYCGAPAEVPPTSTFRPFSCGKPGCASREMFMPQQQWELLKKKKKFNLECPAKLFGVKHGHEVVCEGRLNFDFDSTFEYSQVSCFV